LGAVDADLRDVALGVLVQEEGAPAFDALAAALDKTHDASLRAQIIDALYQPTDATLFARALDFMVSDHVRRGERIMALFDATDLWVNEPRTLAWLPAHVDALAAAMPETSASYLPMAFRDAADTATAAAVRAVFAPRIDKIASLKRTVEEATESINLHVAYVAKQRPSASSFFAAVKSERGAATP
ncbi:MAG TPA: ERAP1-like C-terminal domain-containing protein, partial [Polyangia bacterium]